MGFGPEPAAPAPAPDLPPMAIITPNEFEKRTHDAYVVHIAGKGNMPTDRLGEDNDAWDATKYTTYNTNYPLYKSFKQQAAVYHDLVDHVQDEFISIMAKLENILDGRRRQNGAAGRERLVFTFDGDNYQEDSPFTKIIQLLIKTRYPVYAFRDKYPKPTHVESWLTTANAPYTALVNLQGIRKPGTADQMAPKDYTRGCCDAYVTYGYPKLASIPQPQKDDEILEDGSDKYRRRRPPAEYGKEFDRPGLVMSSMSSELSVDDTSQFVIPYTPESSRYWLLYARRS